MNNWEKLSERKPPFEERVIVFNTMRNKYEVLSLSWEDSEDNIFWIRQGGSVVEINENDWWFPLVHFSEMKIYK